MLTYIIRVIAHITISPKFLYWFCLYCGKSVLKEINQTKTYWQTEWIWLLKQMNRPSLNVCTFVFIFFFFFSLSGSFNKTKQKHSPCLPPRANLLQLHAHLQVLHTKQSKGGRETFRFLLRHSDLQLAAWEFALFSNQSGLVLLLKGDNTECQRWNCVFFIVEGWNPCHTNDPVKDSFSFVIKKMF